MASRKTEVRALVGRPMLSLEYALFLRLLSCWVAGLGIYASGLVPIQSKFELNLLLLRLMDRRLPC